MKILRDIVLGTFAIASFYSCSSADEQKKKGRTAVKVDTYYPTPSSNEGYYLSGEITAHQTATISTRLMGYVNKIHVKPGDKVSAGQLLVSIHSDEIQAKKAQVQAMITEAEAAAQNARRDYERFKTLHAQNSVSDKELENVSLQHTSMQAKVEMAHQQMNEVNAMLAYARIHAPFAGTITQKMMDEGSMANPGMPILMMEQNGEWQVVASVPESYIPYVHVGDAAQVEIKSLNLSLPGMVSELSPSAHRMGGQYAMKLALDTQLKERIHSGMHVNIHIPNKDKESTSSSILIDKQSLVYRDQLTGVYVVDDRNEAQLRWVRLGKTIDSQIEVLSGLIPDDRVVLTAESKLYNGIKVAPSK